MFNFFKKIKVVVLPNGTKHWYYDGKLHRVNGPAIEYSDGTKKWYLNGKLHRVNGPAVIESDGTKYWYLNGKLHRVNGPAIELPDGRKYWYLNGVKMTEQEFNNQINTCSGKIVTIDGRKYRLEEV